eukprot:Gb_25969 [translate_table: standard]
MITEELPPPPLTVDSPSTKENSPLTELIHEVGNSFDEVVEDGDKVAGEDLSSNSSEVPHEINNVSTGNDNVAGINEAVEKNDKATRDGDEVVGETTSTGSSGNKCESFMNSQPMVNQVQGYGMSKFRYASGYNVLCVDLEGKRFCTDMYIIGLKFDILFKIPFPKRYLPVPITVSTLLMNQSSQIASILRLECASIHHHDNPLEMESDNNLQAMEFNEELDMFEEIDKFYREQDEAKGQRRKHYKEIFDFAGFDLDTLAMQEESNIEEQFQDISAILVEKYYSVNPLEYWDKNMSVTKITFAGCYDSGGILFSSKSLMALYRHDPHVKSLVQNHTEKLKCMWQHYLPLLCYLSNSFASQYETLSEELEDDDNMDDAIS